MNALDKGVNSKMTRILIRYGEIALKGKNRGLFENILLKNIKTSLRQYPVEIRKSYGRVFVLLKDSEKKDEVFGLLGRIFGIVSFSPVETAPLSMESIQAKAVEILAGSAAAPFTFKVESRRALKSFPLTSPEISKKAGAYILKNLPGSSVDVHSPQIRIFIEVRENEAYLFHKFYPGPGGLPVGISGKALLLLSGGIDSPVAGWMSMKRGLEIHALHFHSFPFTGERSREKAVDLGHLLSRYSNRITLHIASFTEIQKAIRLNCPPPMSVTIMRRMMFRVAESLARSIQAGALITGESLGQVASQTLENISIINQVTSLPVFRPLIGLDKEEITEKARAIGTYPVSIRPYEDCCTVFLPKNPVIRPTMERTRKAEEALDIPGLVQSCAASVESLTLTPHNRY